MIISHRPITLEDDRDSSGVSQLLCNSEVDDLMLRYVNTFSKVLGTDIIAEWPLMTKEC